jgi:hypothetical protein
MASLRSFARSTAVAGAALVLVVGATFAHDAATGGLPAANPFSAAEDEDGPKADFDQQAGGSDEDAAERPEIDDQFEATDDADQPAEAAEPPKAEKPPKVEKHVEAVKPATKADDEDDNDQGEDEDNGNNDQGEHDTSHHNGSGDGEHDGGGDD